MTNHKKFLPCGAPDLASSAQSWLNENDFEDVDLSHLSESQERRDWPGLSQSWQCERKRVYQALGYDQADYSWSAKTKFDIGNYIEAYWMHALSQIWDIEGSVFMGQREVKLSFEGIEFTGHLDGILSDQGQKYVVECKSMTQATFDARWNDTSVVKMIDDEGVLKFDPLEEEHWNWWGSYVGQVHAYMKAAEIDETLFLFVGRDYGVKCAYMPFMDKAWDRVTDSWETVARAIDISQTHKGPALPARPEEVQELRSEGKSVWKGSDSFPCGYCQFYKECHSDLNPEKKVDDVTGKSYLVMNGGGE